MQDIMLTAFHSQCHLIFPEPSEVGSSYSHFTDEEAKA